LAKEFKGGKPAHENQNPFIGGHFQALLLEIACQ
jgi:hypothetical protein